MSNLSSQLYTPLIFDILPPRPPPTSGVWVDPGGGAVDLQRAAVEDLGETRTHLQTQRSRLDMRTKGRAVSELPLLGGKLGLTWTLGVGGRPLLIGF